MNSLLSIFNKKRGGRQRGFTLIELLVSIAIITILSISLYVQQGKFDSAIHLTNTAQEVALVIMDARKQSMVAEEGVSYGVFFSVGDEGFFHSIKDTTSGTPSRQLVKKYDLGKNTIIPRIEAVGVHGNHDCVAITFERPNPEPRFTTCGGDSVASVSITIQNTTDGTFRIVTVSATSQVSVE